MHNGSHNSILMLFPRFQRYHTSSWGLANRLDIMSKRDVRIRWAGNGQRVRLTQELSKCVCRQIGLRTKERQTMRAQSSVGAHGTQAGWCDRKNCISNMLPPTHGYLRIRVQFTLAFVDIRNLCFRPWVQPYAIMTRKESSSSDHLS